MNKPQLIEILQSCLLKFEGMNHTQQHPTLPTTPNPTNNTNNTLNNNGNNIKVGIKKVSSNLDVSSKKQNKNIDNLGVVGVVGCGSRVYPKKKEKAGEMTCLRDFATQCNGYLRENHLRIMTATQIGRRLRTEGFVIGNRKIGESSAVVITNILLKTIKTIKTIEISNQNPPKETISNLNSFNSFNSNSLKFKEKTPIIDEKVPNKNRPHKSKN